VLAGLVPGAGCHCLASELSRVFLKSHREQEGREAALSFKSRDQSWNFKVAVFPNLQNFATSDLGFLARSFDGITSR